jgi:outer membrane receptor protein involved in Fe transport
VVVTGSLLATNGAKAPTPVTAMTGEQLQLAAPRTVTEALIQLPVFKGSPSVQSQGTGTTSNNGAAYLNLRGLGTQRTLVLLDGRRVVAASSAGSVDVALLPETLIRSVEVVTGGASAAYGSDAVAGVVNFRLDTKFKGLKGSVQSGQTSYNDNKNYKVALAGGTAFMDDRLHAVGSIEHFANDGIETSNRRDWAYHGIGAIPNPNVTASNPASPSNPKQIVVENPYSSIAAPGGLITNTALRGTTFGPGGTPMPFQYGTLLSPTLMAGGGSFNPSLLLVLQPAQTRTAGFGHLTFDLNDKLSLFFETNLARNAVSYNSLPTFELSGTAFTIFKDNAFLPASVAQRMNDPVNPINQVTVGRVSPDLAIPHMEGVSKTQRFVTGFDGKLTDTWNYKGYFQHGENHSVFRTEDDPISDNLYRATDAVMSNGVAVCRSTLTDPTNGCVPLNIFGMGSASAAALAYITGTAIQDVTVKQDVAEVTFLGELFHLQGGPMGVAIGTGWRKEQFDQTTDAISQHIRTGAGIKGYPPGLVNTLGGFERTNPQPSAGDYNVKEAFGETNLPVLADVRFAKSLTLNGAVRYTDYSTSGGVTTWKAGLVYEPIAGLGLRGTRSRDIRAPTLGELFQGSSQGTASIIDRSRGGATNTALTGNIGNTTLLPEIADTTVFGFIVQPSFLPRLSLSADYYDIKLKDAIASLTAQQEVDLCAAGATSLCGFIQRDPNGTISRVRIPFLNVAERTTSGMDVEASYAVPLANAFGLGGGGVSFRLLLNWLNDFTTRVQGAPRLQLAGDIGINSTPKLSGIFSVTLDAGPASLYVQERYIGSGNYDNTLTPTDISDNHVPSIAYTDATFTYSLKSDSSMRVFLTANNLLDKDPPPVPGILISGSSLGNRLLYDVAGRSFTAGLRFNF